MPYHLLATNILNVFVYGAWSSRTLWGMDVDRRQADRPVTIVCEDFSIYQIMIQVGWFSSISFRGHDICVRKLRKTLFELVDFPTCGGWITGRFTSR